MAELSNDGSGLAAATSSARIRPYASLMPSSVGASGRIVARMPARWSSTEVSGLTLDHVAWASSWLCLPLAYRPRLAHGRLSRYLRSQGTISSARSDRSHANWTSVRR